MRRMISLIVLSGAAIAAGCRGTSLPTYSNAPVIVVSIDTLRADHLPAYGYRSGRTPVLDGLARESVLFERAFAHVPLTLPSHATLLTGQLPPHHHVRDNAGFTLAATQPTLATRLKTAGWRTGAAVSAYVLRRQTGIAQGFEFYDDALPVEGSLERLGAVQRDGQATVDALAAWTAGAGDRFFAFLHLYEPHTPYAPPEGYRDRPTPYDGEISYADALVGRFLEPLRASGVLDRAILVVTSDHGEGLGDHGEGEHGVLLYREALHVPLLIRLPGAQRGGSRVSETVGLADVAATVLDLVGLTTDGLDGRSLRTALASGRADARRVYSETLYPRLHYGWRELYAATDDRWRLIRGAPTLELFDAAADPGERNDLSRTNGSETDRLDAWLDPFVAAGGEAQPAAVPADVAERLRALGYASAGRPPGDGAERPHPRDRVAAEERFRAALTLRDEGQTDRALTELRALTGDNPSMVDAWMALGATLARLGDSKEGVAAFKKVLDIDPLSPEAHSALARIYALGGQGELARSHAELAARGDPADGFELLAQLSMDEGALDRAAEFARQSLAADDRRIVSRFIVGLAAKQAGRCDEAVEAFRAADAERRLRRAAVVRGLHAHTADCLARLGRAQEAEQEFRAEIEAIPSSAEARVGLAMLYASQGRADDVREVMRELVAATPAPGREIYWTVVRTLTVLGDREGAREWAARARARFPDDQRFRGPAAR